MLSKIAGDVDNERYSIFVHTLLQVFFHFSGLLAAILCAYCVFSGHSVFIRWLLFSASCNLLTKSVINHSLVKTDCSALIAFDIAVAAVATNTHAAVTPPAVLSLASDSAQ